MTVALLTSDGDVKGPTALMPTRIESLCIEKGLKMTDQRRVIARVLSEADDHPDVEEVHRRAAGIDARISLATVYRTVRVLEDAEIIERLDFGDGRARYEQIRDDHHHHLIDLQTGEVHEFADSGLEALKEQIARDLGFNLIGHRLELYGIRPDDADTAEIDAHNAGERTPDDGDDRADVGPSRDDRVRAPAKTTMDEFGKTTRGRDGKGDG